MFNTRLTKENRIARMKARAGKDNGNIIKKIERQLRKMK